MLTGRRIEVRGSKDWGPGVGTRTVGPGGPGKVLGMGVRVVGRMAAAWKGLSRFGAELDKHLLLSKYSG
jgi:hypothetical protein